MLYAKMMSGIMFVVVFFAQAAPSVDPYSAFWQLGIGAAIAVPFAVDGRMKAKRISQLEHRMDKLQTDQLQRERALADRMAPMLESALKAGKETQQGVENVVSRRVPTVLDTLGRLENLVSALEGRAAESGP